MSARIIQGDALEVLKTLPSDHFHCVVTSPPYHNLRDYGVSGQIGLEPTVEEWVAALVAVFREVRRVLRRDGVCFVNLGDGYASTPNGRSAADTKAAGHDDRTFRDKPAGIPAGLKPKDLVGQPWRLAFALQADGWWLRGDYIWAKPNPMPESVRDRCTKAHEYVFHLSKSDRYFWDAEAVREGVTGNAHSPPQGSTKPEHHVRRWDHNFEPVLPSSRNLRSVWTIATEPLPSIIVDGEKLDHFASYPVELARRCIMAGTSAKGCCPECGAPWSRVVERTEPSYWEQRKTHDFNGRKAEDGPNDNYRSISRGRPENSGVGYSSNQTTGWHPTCSCPSAELQPCRVLDPFGGSGRTALAAEELGRDCTLIELNPKSVAMAQAQLERAKARRMIGDCERIPVPEGQLGLFG